METAMLSRDQILKADDLPTEVIEVPEWGGQVCIRTMSGTERDAFESSLIGSGGKDTARNMRDLRARFASLVIVDEDGKRLFTAKDIEALGGKSALVLDRILTVGQRLNGLTSEDVDDLAGNSMSEQPGGSTLDLP